jgi:hypothetical protein
MKLHVICTVTKSVHDHVYVNEVYEISKEIVISKLRIWLFVNSDMKNYKAHRVCNIRSSWLRQSNANSMHETEWARPPRDVTVKIERS